MNMHSMQQFFFSSFDTKHGILSSALQLSARIQGKCDILVFWNLKK